MPGKSYRDAEKQREIRLLLRRVERVYEDLRTEHKEAFPGNFGSLYNLIIADMKHSKQYSEEEFRERGFQIRLKLKELEEYPRKKF